MFSSYIATFLVGLLPLVVAVCECGYRTNTQEVFQYSLVTAFNTTSAASFKASADWVVSSQVLGASSSRPYATNYTSSNVNVVNKTLQLTCSAYNSTITNSVRSAQILTSRSDILHGSFRATFNVAGNGTGVVGGLFFYANDSQEADIEVLTRDNARSAHFTNQPDTTTVVYMPNGLKRTDTNDYRLDWTAQNTKYYVNNVLSSTLTTDVPVTNGSVFMNLWGGSSFAGATPPQSDVTMSISGIQLYFNTSDAALSRTWSQACSSAKAKVCDVDSQSLQQNTTSSSGAAEAYRGPSLRKSKPSYKDLASRAVFGLPLPTVAAMWLWGA